MPTFTLARGSVTLDPEALRVSSVLLEGSELVRTPVPLLTLGLRSETGESRRVSVSDARAEKTEPNALSLRADLPEGIRVHVRVTAEDDALLWRVRAENGGSWAVEWIDFPSVCLQPLRKNGGEGEILTSWNEGVLIDDLDRRERSWFPFRDPEYPSLGAYAMFPHMLSSQFICYLNGEGGLYTGVHDERRGPKMLDVRPQCEGASMVIRLFAGGDPGEDFAPDYPVVWRLFRGGWEDGAEIYRRWFETHLPDNVKKTAEDPALPEWYADSPLVVTYPVRGIHDMDEMTPNALFPYTNALPLIDGIASRTGWRIMAVLMHWEGTAPWAPPFVWPPFGGEDCFREFMDALHRRGALLGVYCSGFGFTEQSNLIGDYNNEALIGERGYKEAFCAGPDGEVLRSRICTGQRRGYDICVGSEKGREILAEAYGPLFRSGVDYAQILDQNHGGSQYFCYSRKHGHPFTPGPWATETMRDLLDSWNREAPGMLFGCESAAAEPYIGNLRFSDNRFELNWHIGRPVPLFAYLYHEYLRNFMGNQVSCPLDAEDADGNTVDTLRMRMAYSFAAGDSMTLVLTPEGKLMANWGRHDFTHIPDFDKTMDFAANMRRAYEKAKPFLFRGRMVKCPGFSCGSVSFPVNGVPEEFPAVFGSAWEADGRRILLLVNHTDEPAPVVTASGKELTVPPRDAVVKEL